MRISRLSIVNLFDNTSKVYDCQELQPNVLSLKTEDLNNFKLALTAGFYGRDNILVPYKSGEKINVFFSNNEKAYVLTRTFKDSQDEVELNIEGEDTSIKNSEEISAFIKDTLKVSKFAFQKMLEVDVLSIEMAFNKSPEERNSYIKNLFDNLIDKIDGIEEERTTLSQKAYDIKTKLNLLEDHSEDDVNILVKEIVAADNKIKASKEELIKLRNEIARGDEFFTIQNRYESLLKDKDKINERAKNIEEIEAVLEKSNEALMLSGLYQKKDELSNQILDTEKEIIKVNELLKAVRKKVVDGTAASKDLDKDYVYLEEKSKQLNKVMQDIILKGRENPSKLNIDEEVNNYYYEVDEELKLIEKRKKEVDKLYNQICTECAILEERKKEIHIPAKTKKAITEGALFEEFINNQSVKVANAQSELETVKRLCVSLKDELKEQDQKIKLLEENVRTQEESMKGKFASLEESVNNDILVKQTLYSDHIMLASFEEEVVAIDRKIQKLEVVKGDYTKKIRLLEEAKEDIEEHKEECYRLREEFIERKISILGQNKLADIIDSVEYGEKCPVCETFIIDKKAPARSDTALVDGEIEAFDKLIAEDDKKLREVINSIGKYDSALRVNIQYIKTLQENKETKMQTINGILQHANAKNSEDLETKLKESISKSNRLRFSMEKYAANKEKLAVLKEFREEASRKIKDLEKFDLSNKENDNRELKKILDNAKKEYKYFDKELKGEKASSMLQKLIIVEKEIETLDKELQEKLEKKTIVFAEKQELESAILALRNKAILVDIEGVNYSYKELIAKVIAEKLGEIIDAIGENEKLRENAKLRIVALRKVLKKQSMEVDELNIQLNILKDRKNVLEETLAAIKKNYDERFIALGITSKVELGKLILDKQTAIDYAKEIRDFDEDKFRNSQSIKDALVKLEEYSDYFLRYEQKKEKEAALDDSLTKDTLLIASLMKKREKVISVIEKRNAFMRELDSLSKNIEELSALISSIPSNKNDIAESLSKYIVNEASKMLWEYSEGDYRLTFKESKINLIKIKEDNNDEIRNKPTEAEKKVLNFILAAAVKKVFDKMLKADKLPALLTLDDKESSIMLAKAIAGYAKYREMIIMQNSQAILKNVSKCLA